MAREVQAFCRCLSTQAGFGHLFGGHFGSRFGRIERVDQRHFVRPQSILHGSRPFLSAAAFARCERKPQKRRSQAGSHLCAARWSAPTVSLLRQDRHRMAEGFSRLGSSVAIPLGSEGEASESVAVTWPAMRSAVKRSCMPCLIQRSTACWIMGCSINRTTTLTFRAGSLPET